jgi:hypothetical protein
MHSTSVQRIPRASRVSECPGILRASKAWYSGWRLYLHHLAVLRESELPRDDTLPPGACLSGEGTMQPLQKRRSTALHIQVEHVYILIMVSEAYGDHLRNTTGGAPFGTVADAHHQLTHACSRQAREN